MKSHSVVSRLLLIPFTTDSGNTFNLSVNFFSVRKRGKKYSHRYMPFFLVAVMKWCYKHRVAS